MSSFEKLDNIGHRIYAFLTNPRVVKFSFYAATFIFFSCLIIGYLIAQLDFAGPGIDKQGFNIVDDFISNLGNRSYTPITNFLDDGAMFTAIFMIPMAFYMEKMVSEKKDGDEPNLMRTRLASYGLLTMLVGIIGLWGIGFFNEEIGRAFGDVAFGLDFHQIFSAVVFLGLGSTGLVFGIVIVFYHTEFPKILGAYMIFVPFTLAILYLTSNPLIIWLEWLLLLSLFGYLVPCGVCIVKHIKNTTEGESKKIPNEKTKGSIIDKIEGLKEILVSPKLIKSCIILFFIVFIPSLIVGIVVANIYDPARDGYDIVRNFISDLGSLDYTYIPKFLDDAAMISAFLLIPVMFYLKKILTNAFLIKEKKTTSRIIGKILTNLGLFFGLLSMVGFFGIGFFSEDTSRELSRFNVEIFGLSTHMFFSIVVFACLILTGLFMGAYLVIFPKFTASNIDRKIPPYIFVLLGLEMMIWPTIHGIGFVSNWPPSQP
ncbi:MAG: DUF998 domain-containing protein, partial [Candidatus Lokiarchaeota archaeon]|nr:DUF998 domain-containing protein [Candidatus Lokiarchaeota archaeon]